MGIKNPDEAIEIRKMAGLRPPVFSIYYNLAGPERGMTAARVDGKDMFAVKMEIYEYQALSEDFSGEEAYRILYGLHEEEN
jgi:hypothetical protein